MATTVVVTVVTVVWVVQLRQLRLVVWVVQHLLVLLADCKKPGQPVFHATSL